MPNPNGRPNSDVLKPWANGFELSRGPQHQWVIDFGIEIPELDAALYERPFAYVSEHVKPERLNNNRESYRKYWWRFAEARPGLRAALKPLPRFIATVAHSKHRFFVWIPVTTSPDQALITVARSDDANFGILHSRFHELWSLRMGTSLEDRPRYTPTTCFETFPFPEGLAPADTAHQQTEAVPGSAHGALIPAGLADTAVEAGQGRGVGAMCEPPGGRERPPRAPALPGEHHNPTNAPSLPSEHHNPANAPSLPGQHHNPANPSLKTQATRIAEAAARLNALRENWLNPPEWTERVPEVVPLGLDKSPYPDRIVPRAGLSEQDAKALQKRTLTNLYNQRPAWLAMAHEALDTAVAAAYGWADYSPQMPDDEILARLLALNLRRGAA